MRRLRRSDGGDAVTWTLIEYREPLPLWSVTVGGQRHELAAGDASGAAHCYGWTCLAPGEVQQVEVIRGGDVSVWRVERRVQSVCAMEVV